MFDAVLPLTFFKTLIANIAGKKHTNKRYKYYFPGIFLNFFASNFLQLGADEIHELFDMLFGEVEFQTCCCV